MTLELITAQIIGLGIFQLVLFHCITKYIDVRVRIVSKQVEDLHKRLFGITKEPTHD